MAAEGGRIVRSNRHNKAPAPAASAVCTHQCLTAELSVENCPGRHILSLTVGPLFARVKENGLTTTPGHVHAFINVRGNVSR